MIEVSSAKLPPLYVSDRTEHSPVESPVEMKLTDGRHNCMQVWQWTGRVDLAPLQGCSGILATLNILTHLDA